MSDLVVAIVSFNTREKLRMTLRSLYASKTNFQFEVVVVDNASADGSSDMVRDWFPQSRLIQNQENLGFSKANNLAIRSALPFRYFLLLNSDVEVAPDTLEQTMTFMEKNSSVGIVGPRVKRDDGSLDLACRRSFPSPRNSFFHFSGLAKLFPKSRFASYNLTYLPEDRTVDVDSVMGAFLLIRQETIEQIGLLNEDYFMYGEDLDWCWRAKEAGWRVVYAPITSVIHHKGSSSRKAPKKALYEFHRSMALFYDAHYRGKHGFLFTTFVKIGIWSVYLVKLIINNFRSEKIVSK